MMVTNESTNTDGLSLYTWRLLHQPRPRINIDTEAHEIDNEIKREARYLKWHWQASRKHYFEKTLAA